MRWYLSILLVCKVDDNGFGLNLLAKIKHVKNTTDHHNFILFIINNEKKINFGTRVNNIKKWIYILVMLTGVSWPQCYFVDLIYFTVSNNIRVYLIYQWICNAACYLEIKSWILRFLKNINNNGELNFWNMFCIVSYYILTI